mgnify:CR=1 FL=1
MTMSKQIKDIQATDSFELGTERTITPEGFLEAPAIIARTGVQLYRARELGLDKHGISGDQIVRLHRPAEELFNPATIASFHNKPVINGSHKTVTADNWKELSVGDMHHPEPNGKVLRVRHLSVKDKGAVGDVINGKKFTSIGYKFDIDLTPGTNADGEAYDGIQRNIVGNHVLITDSPRGGPVCAIADTATVKEGERKMRKVIVNGVPVEVGDSEAGIIESLVQERDAARNKPTTILYLGAQHTGDAIVKLLEGKDAEIKQLKDSATKPEQIEALVNSRAQTIGDAGKLVEGFEHAGKSNKQIHQEVLNKVISGDETQKAVVEAILGGKSVGDASEESLATAFRAVAAAKPAKVEGTTGADSAVAAALTSKKDTIGGDANVPSKPVGRAGFVERMNNAWKPKQ